MDENPYSQPEEWGEGSAHVPGLVLKALGMLTEPIRRAYHRYTEGQYEGNPYEQGMMAAMDAADAQYPEYGGGLPGPAAVQWPTGEKLGKAFLHRRIKDPREVGWLADIYRAGDVADKPTSFITPEYLSTFRSDPYGFIWHVKNPENMVHIGAQDLYSAPAETQIATSGKEQYVDELQQLLAQELSKLKEYDDIGTDLFSQMLFKETGKPIHTVPDELLGGMSPETVAYDILGQEGMPGLKPHSDEIQNLLANKRMEIDELYDEIQRHSKNVATWAPLYSTIDPHKTSLPEMFRKQRDMIAEPYEIFGAEINPKSKKLFHNETVYRIGDPSELAGVRLPSSWTPENHIDMPLYDALRDFAEDMHVPTFEFPHDWRLGDQLDMLNDVIKSGAQGGTWENAPWNRRTITSRWGSFR
jgi:hypothetical protein